MEVSEFLIEFVSVIDGLADDVVEDVIECVRELLGLIVTEGLPDAELLGHVVREELGLTVTVRLGDPVTDSLELCVCVPWADGEPESEKDTVLREVLVTVEELV